MMFLYYLFAAFNLPGPLNRHYQTHTGALPFPCPFPDCDAAFPDNRPRKKHLMTVHGVEDPKAILARPGRRPGQNIPPRHPPPPPPHDVTTENPFGNPHLI